MKPQFVNEIAESSRAYLDLMGHAEATFYEVYSGIPSFELEGLIKETLPGEQFLRFDMQGHSEEAKARFCYLGYVERRAYDFPDNVKEKPLPHFKTYVRGMGPVGIAWSLSEVPDLIAHMRQDVLRMRYAAEILKKSKSHPTAD